MATKRKPLKGHALAQRRAKKAAWRTRLKKYGKTGHAKGAYAVWRKKKSKKLARRVLGGKIKRAALRSKVKRKLRRAA